VKSAKLLLLLLVAVIQAHATQLPLTDEKESANVLIVCEGSTSLKNPAIARGRQLATLLGHFDAQSRVLGVDEYIPHTFSRYSLVVYIGFRARYDPPGKFMDDVLASRTPVIWMDTGFKEFSERPEVRKTFGFTVSHIDSLSNFEQVRGGGRFFTKGEANINMIEIADRKAVQVVATAISAKKRWEVPYIVRSGFLTYIADCPFASASETDRYIYFADMLHDILGQEHEQSHTALIRIEDVTPLENPASLRDIADILSSRGVPFLVGVVPFYVNPGEGIRVSLSDKPDLVDALRYMTQNGGTIVMHGSTHQYHGTSTADYEFWDENTGRPIKDETAENDARKIEMGIQELLKNGLMPLVWETPHYGASFKFYETVSRYFSAAMEQRLSMEDLDAGQTMPYMINRDLFGQRLIPENLGYVPLDPDPKVGQEAVRRIAAGARANLFVRDGFAANFFHAFVDHALLSAIVDSVQHMGYSYMDVRDLPLKTQLKDRVILTGKQEYAITLTEQYLQESVYDRNGDLVSSVISDARMNGTVRKTVDLEPGQIYRAEPVEFRERTPSMAERAANFAREAVKKFFGGQETWQEARVLLLWNQYARGSAYNDQASFAAVFRSVNLPVDTVFVGQQLPLAGHNLVVVPYGFVDSLADQQYDDIARFVREGGNLISDMPNDLVTDLGIRLGTTRLQVSRVRDHLYPEEHIRWRYPQLATKFNAETIDEVFASDDETDAPLVVGRAVEKGKIIYISTWFDPESAQGYSHYPFLLDYVGSYFRLGPVVRRENLEVYFEPGSRARTMSIETLVKHWVRDGIRTVHVSGWHEYPPQRSAQGYTYDYRRLISLAHANGILVYPWLEPPQVSPKFYAQHPEWREKNIRSADVTPSWRNPVALTDPACLRAATEWYREFLTSYDWDGVNLAELYFEAGRGFQDPLLFTPMHPSAQKEFRHRYGYDLRSIFDSSSAVYWKSNPGVRHQVSDYRVGALTRAYDTLLTMINAVAKSRPGFTVIVTAMDSKGSPDLREQLGVDMDAILALRAKYSFVLQVEDPEPLWSTDPLRYIEIGRRYTDLLAGSDSSAREAVPLMLDLNIGQFRRPEKVTPFPTLTQTGTESFFLVRAAAKGAPGMTIYSESSTNPQDLKFFPFALAADVKYTRTDRGYEVESPRSFALKLPLEVSQIELDGVLLSPGRENCYLVPAGKHTIAAAPKEGPGFSTHELETRILSFTGNLISATYGIRTVTVGYDAARRTLISLNREPTAVTIDGVEVPCTMFRGNDCYSLFLPAGRHTALIVAGDAFSYGVSLTSFWSSNAIAIFGSVAVLLLAGMYVTLKIIRRRYA
jgi:uncharacterized protein YdaL